MDIIKIKADDDSDILPFIDLFGLHYEQRASAAEFYNQFRYLVSASLKKKGDIITWMNNSVMLIDEQLSPTFEELILAVVLGLIDNRLPGRVGKNPGLKNKTQPSGFFCFFFWFFIYICPQERSF